MLILSNKTKKLFYHQIVGVLIMWLITFLNKSTKITTTKLLVEYFFLLLLRKVINPLGFLLLLRKDYQSHNKYINNYNHQILYIS